MGLNRLVNWLKMFWAAPLNQAEVARREQARKAELEMTPRYWAEQLPPLNRLEQESGPVRQVADLIDHTILVVGGRRAAEDEQALMTKIDQALQHLTDDADGQRWQRHFADQLQAIKAVQQASREGEQKPRHYGPGATRDGEGYD